MITIDGSYLEGGGQILRTAIALSAITQKPVCVENIRAGRPKPGLKPSHLASISLASEFCDADHKGLGIGSQRVEFYPGKIHEVNVNRTIGTAGSITLVFQAIAPIACFAPKKSVITLHGGTNVAWSPPVEFFTHVFSHTLEKHMSPKIRTKEILHGFYPKGGGAVKIEVSPAKIINPINLTKQGKLQKIDLHAVASESLCKAKVCERMIAGFKSICPEKNISEHIKYVKTASVGASLHAHAHYENTKLGAEALGKRGTPAESVGKECARKLGKEMASGAAVDHRLADQLMIFMALANGNSEIKTSRISNHIKTNKYVIEQFLPVKFEIIRNVIKCKKI